MPFRSNKVSGFRDISAVEQTSEKTSLLPPSLFHMPSVRPRKEKEENHSLSCGIYSFQLFGSRNNEIICIFNSSSLDYSITLHLCAYSYRFCALSIELSVQNSAENRKRRAQGEKKRDVMDISVS